MGSNADDSRFVRRAPRGFGCAQRHARDSELNSRFLPKDLSSSLTNGGFFPSLID
ncbi:hypothetical protein NEUTE1DRAFT_119196 [Neurospora tetrasperma FGSC 2508]|uniref:Uncharacterized protein n=1 Tax=Neurospora tetrasperma (strain FGSC 2508 / ATCC MYA-4615 / P0657) TaxID=510951 RepID=F8N3Q9_NEUT8|nr:uncharacterized protein NEUTE1DRAFT_119196 [Neurospora tetrasperma FGSC 2508]EGO53460.1 hypothetical protein NEUTE1DRAFT_119196 [Neurospora tetrasperma FGSC 2508]